ncbi:uncharacterized protein LOC130957190 [Arachis stenosperma]|uniref:uncharacterized protein LOC130957190 n=1 Tax=Arachis stenosperma TaxID=217475 RepID=UPI0025ACF769|nr:uncharacterized protein LOC130957190 [Arachis stenosperma]
MELEGVDTLLAQNKIMQEQIQQQFEQMAKKIDSLQVTAVNTSQPSTKWGQNEENQEDQQQEQPQYVHNQSSGQNEVYGDIYNPSWKNHPNIRWGDNYTQNQQPWQRNSNQNNSRNNQNHNQQNTNPNPYRKPQNNHSNSSYCPPNNQTTNQNTHHQPSTPHNQPQTSQDTQRISNLETLIEKMMKHQETMMEKLMKNQEMARQDQEAARKDQATTSKNQEASIKNLERHMEQMAKRITDASPSATQDHPKDKGKATKWEECKAIIVESEKKAINQEEHNREVPQEETEERSEEDQKIKNAKSSKRDKDILETQLQEKKERVKPHIPKLPYPQRELPEKKDDPGSFYIPCTIGDITIEKSFCDLGASINLMPLSLMRKLRICELKSTRILLQMADKSIQQAVGVVENVLVKVGKFLLPADFVILDMEEDPNTPIILGRPFLATGRALIDVEKGELLLRVHDEHLAFHVFKTPHEPTQEEECTEDTARDQSLKEVVNELAPRLPNPCLKEVEMVQQTKEIKEELDPKPPDEKFNISDKEPPRQGIAAGILAV